MIQANEEIDIVAVVKGSERYVFLFDHAHRAEALRTVCRFAADAELSFSWYDCASVSQQIRKAAL